MNDRQQQAEIVERRCKQNERIGDGYTRTVSRLRRERGQLCGDSRNWAWGGQPTGCPRWKFPL